MVLHAHFKKYIITLGVWFLCTLGDPPAPRFGKRPLFFRIFCVATFPYTVVTGLLLQCSLVFQWCSEKVTDSIVCVCNALWRIARRCISF